MATAMLFAPNLPVESSLLQSVGLDTVEVASVVAMMEGLRADPTVEIVLFAFPYADIIETIRKQFPYVAVIILATHPSVNEAVSCMQAGAVSYLPLESLNPRPMQQALERAQHERRRRLKKAQRQQRVLSLLRDIAADAAPDYPIDLPTLAPIPEFAQHDSGHCDSTRLEIRGVEIDLHTHEVRFHEQAIELSPTEYDILETLMQAQGQLVSFEALAQAVHGVHVERGQARSLLSAHISNLRNKLRDAGCDNYIINRRGRGYYIDSDVESALQRGGETMRLIMDATSDIILHLDAEGVVEYLSASVQQVLGYHSEIFLGTPLDSWHQLFHPDDAHVIHDLMQHIEAALPYENSFRVRHAEGHYRWVEARGDASYNDHEATGMILVARDIDERQRALQNLQISEARLRLLLENVPDLIITVDREGTIRYSNRDNEQLCGQNVRVLASTQHDVALLDHVRRAYLHPHQFEEYLHLSNAKGECIETRIRFCPVPGHSNTGKIEDLMLIITDISEQQRALQRIRESEERYRILAEHMSDLIALHRPDGTFIYLSPSCKRVLGYEIEDLLGTNPYQLYHPQDVATFHTRAHEPALRGEGVEVITYRMRRKDGHYIWLESSIQPVLDNSGSVAKLVSSSRDVTYRRGRAFENALENK